MFCDVITRLAVSISFDEFQDASVENRILLRLEEPVLYSSKQNNNRRDLPPVVIPRPATAAAAGLKSSSFTAQLTQRGAKLPKCRLCPETPLYSKRTY